MIKYLKSLFKRIESIARERSSYDFLVKDWINLSDLDACSDVLRTMRFTNNIRPSLVNPPNKRNIIVISPHPDDEIIGPGGTLIKSIEQGSKVKVIYLTSGGKTKEEKELREMEAQEVAERIGFEVDFVRQNVNEISLKEDILINISSMINSFKPDILFVTFLLDDHDDHRRASEILFRIYERKELRDDLKIWAFQIYGSVIPNIIVDITDVHNQKSELIKLFNSQTKSRDWAHYALGLNAYNSRLLEGGNPESYVESFFSLPLKDYAEFCSIYFSHGSNKIYYSEYYRSER